MMDLGWLEKQIDSLFSWKRRFGKWVNDWHSYLSKRIDSLGDDMDDIAEDVILIPSTVRKAVDDAKEAILKAVKETYITPLSHYVDTFLMDVKDWIGDIYKDLLEVHKDLKAIFDFIEDIDIVIDARIEGLKDKIIGWIEDKFISIVEHVLEQEKKE